MLTHLSLFSGIGGLDLAAEWAGMVTVGQCERADYPHAVLCKHFYPIFKAIAEVEEENHESTTDRTHA